MAVKIVVFDMDGVLVDVKSSWQFVHEAFGATNKENVERYVSGQISYAELMKRDISLWGNVHISKIRSILSTAPLMKGAGPTIAALKQAGLKTAIASADISILAEQLRDRLGLDYVFANRIIADEKGILTGKGEEVVSLLNKAATLRKIAGIEETSPSNCAVVGDSIFDIPLFDIAGLGIAFNADDYRVRKAADFVVSGKDLTKILPYLVEQGTHGH